MAQVEPPCGREDAEGESADAALPLPDPFPDYITCPHCGEPEVEVWCFEVEVYCHACGARIEHRPPPCCGMASACAEP